MAELSDFPEGKLRFESKWVAPKSAQIHHILLLPHYSATSTYHLC